MRLFLLKNRMKSVKFVLIYALVASVALVSCKKDNEEDEVLPSILGDVSYNLPLYAFAGDVFDLNAVGVTDPTDKSLLTYSWISKGIIIDTLKTQNVTVTMPDSLATYSMQLTIASTGYYSRTVTKLVTVVDPAYNGSLTGIPQGKDSIRDRRDSQWYHIVKIGNLEWFAQNLNWTGAGAGYGKTDAMGTIMGRLYTWKDATGGVSASGLGQGPQGVCPEGWSIPTNEDWMDLAKAVNGNVELPFANIWKGIGEKLMVNATFNTTTPVWPYSANATPTNQFGWNALAGGSATNDYNNYSGLFSYAFWWSATEYSANQANYRYMYYDQPDFPLNYTDKNGFAASVRCVRLKQN